VPAVLGLAVLVPAGCGSSVVRTQGAAMRGTPARHPAARRCTAAARLTPGVAFPGWHMGAVQFLSASSGVGITAEDFPCFHQVTGGVEAGSRRQLVRLAVTSDGGRSWRVTGRTLPIGSVAGGAGVEQVAATSSTDVWALVGRGRLVATHDGGSDWQLQTIPGWIDALTIENGVVWAVSCPRVAGGGCRPELWRTGSAGGAWTRVALPRITVQSLEMPQLAIAPDNRDIALYEPTNPSGELLTSRDSGLHWTRRRPPTWEHNSCDIVAALLASPQRTFWLLCIGGAAAGSSTKGLLRSTDAGRNWVTVSAITSLQSLPPPDSIPAEEPSALAAGSRTRLWMSLSNGLAESNDGGRHWTSARIINPEGWSTTLDVLDADHAWLLAAGAGLWRTTDGIHWHTIGPLNTHSFCECASERTNGARSDYSLPP
jgi:hypothetical protein